MKILLSGATGFIGQALLKKLIEQKHQIYALVRSSSNTLDPSITQITLSSSAPITEQFDAFINLAGENIAAQPWSKKRKKALYDSRIGLTREIKERLTTPPKRVISMSAIGYYGMTQEGLYQENSLPSLDYAHALCNAWENAAKSFLSHQTRVVIFRLGVVLGKEGALKKMRLPFCCGLGGPIASGEQWFSWVHINDVVNAIITAMKNDAYFGTYNLVAPQHVTQRSFAQSYAHTLNRPALLSTPKWLLHRLFGEMSGLLTEGPRISSEKILEQGFTFTFTSLDKALLDIEQAKD